MLNKKQKNEEKKRVRPAAIIFNSNRNENATTEWQQHCEWGTGNIQAFVIRANSLGKPNKKLILTIRFGFTLCSNANRTMVIQGGLKKFKIDIKFFSPSRCSCGFLR